MEFEVFQNLPTAEVARLVRLSGPKVCVFPINGTRRWFILEHEVEAGEDLEAVYCEVAARCHVELYRLFFDHGVDTLLTPIFGPDLLDRGSGYADMAIEGLALLGTHPEFVGFYREYRVRVRFYGDYRAFFDSTAHAHLSDLFDDVTAQTAAHDQHRLFFGVCAHDPSESIARQAVQYHAERGQMARKRDLIEMYYGEYVEPVSLFIGFDKLCAFDMPLVATGNEDLYFTVSPSPYLSQPQLRAILYDHLYNRRQGEPDYLHTEPEDLELMRSFYRLNAGRTLGIGVSHGQTWYPLPQVDLPQGFKGLICSEDSEETADGSDSPSP